MLVRFPRHLACFPLWPCCCLTAALLFARSSSVRSLQSQLGQRHWAHRHSLQRHLAQYSSSPVGVGWWGPCTTVQWVQMASLHSQRGWQGQPTSRHWAQMQRLQTVSAQMQVAPTSPPHLVQAVWGRRTTCSLAESWKKWLVFQKSVADPDLFFSLPGSHPNSQIGTVLVIIHNVRSSSEKNVFYWTLGLLKERSNDILNPSFFLLHISKRVWATDQQAKLFSISVNIFF